MAAARVGKSYLNYLLRKFVDVNVHASHQFDRLLPVEFVVDGNRDFVDSFVPLWLREGVKIIDIGGGKNPYLSTERKASLRARVTGIDISKSELARAPVGAYDETICIDIAHFTGAGDADFCICQAVLEHVPDTQAAFRAIASSLKPGGIALIFVPSRNAAFARLNLILPQRVKQFLLFNVFPHTRRNQGFPSYYNRCTPRDFEEMARGVGLSIADRRYYYVSSYFSFFAPLYVLWRAWILIFSTVVGKQAAETFSYAFVKAQDESNTAIARPGPPG